jgi:hypothetical protein
MSNARFRVVACGRRFGKTTLGQLEIIRIASNAGRCWWLAPTYDMAGQVWRDLRRIAIDMNHGIRVSQSEQRIDFPNGGLIAIRSAHYPDNLRGMGLDFAVLDEAAFMDSTVWPEVVRPMLLERRGGALFLSSPNGRNWFWELFKLGLLPEEDEWASFHFTSYDNPLIPASEIDALRRVTPERVYREEYLAEFIADSGQVFRGIREAATAPIHPQPIPNRRYIAGIDWGRESDFTVIVIVDAETRHMVALDRFNQVSWALQRGRLKALVERWNPLVIWAEANSIGSPNIEALQAEGLPVRPFMTTASSKNPLIEALALAIERRELALLPDEILLDELTVYQLERLPAGGYRYHAPPGLHDDCVIALALAWHGVRYSGLTIDFA